MLPKKNGDELSLSARPLKAREDELLLELPVVVLDETPNDARSAREHREIELLAMLDPARCLVVDEQDALEDPMLLHQVLTGGDLGFLVGVPGRGGLTAACRSRRRAAHQRQPGRGCGGSQDVPVPIAGRDPTPIV
jgi:hypothetical protein